MEGSRQTTTTKQTAILTAEATACKRKARMNFCFSGLIGMKQLQKYRFFQTSSNSFS
jgi:hypothetical protein